MFNLFGSNDDNTSAEDQCPTSGWGVRPSAASDGTCPQGHSATTTPAGKSAVRINPHGRR